MAHSWLQRAVNSRKEPQGRPLLCGRERIQPILHRLSTSLSPWIENNHLSQSDSVQSGDRTMDLFPFAWEFLPPSVLNWEWTIIRVELRLYIQRWLIIYTYNLMSLQDIIYTMKIIQGWLCLQRYISIIHRSDHVYNDIYSERWLYIHWPEHPADPNRHLLPTWGKMPNQSRIPTTSQKHDKKIDWANESQVL